MTKDDVIRVAREADPGFEGGEESDGTMTDSIVGIDQVLKFASLIAAAEREACVAICEHGWKIGIGEKYQGDVFATAIHARGNQ